MIFFKDYMSYDFEPAYKLVQSKWLKNVDSEMYREGMLHIYKLISTQGIQGWLYDASQYTAPDIRDQIWTVEVLGSLLAETSLQKLAVIVPKDIFLQAVAEKVLNKSHSVFKGNIIMENFFDLESAREWLITSSNLPGAENKAL